MVMSFDPESIELYSNGLQMGRGTAPIDPAGTYVARGIMKPVYVLASDYRQLLELYRDLLREAR
jgi:hypothetical protein